MINGAFELLVCTAIMTAARKAEVEFSKEETATMEFLNARTAPEGIRLETTPEPGDVQFCFNHAVPHSRTAHQEWPEPECRRHLLRLWLSDLSGRSLAPEFAHRYEQGVEHGCSAGPGAQVRGGYVMRAVGRWTRSRSPSTVPLPRRSGRTAVVGLLMLASIVSVPAHAQ